MIDEVDPALYEQETQPAAPRIDYAPAAEPRPDYAPSAPRPDYAPAAPRSDYAPVSRPYVPASGPAFATARQDLGPGALEASVAAGANAYGAAVNPVSFYLYIFLSIFMGLSRISNYF